MGEFTEVASAKRAVLGVWSVRPDEELEVLARTSTCVFAVFPSGWLFDMLSDPAADVRCPSFRYPDLGLVDVLIAMN